VEDDITINYAHPVSSSVVRPAYIHYEIDKADRVHAEAWIAQLLDLAYGKAQRRKRIKVLINPYGGKGKAQKYYGRDIEPILAAARCEIDAEKTQYAGHAVDIIAEEKFNVDAWDVVACCSGDGVPYEVFNGLAKKANAGYALAQVAVVQFPCGSGNAMSLNNAGTDSPSLAALSAVKGIRTAVDLASITQGDSRTVSFLSQSVGIVAEVDLGTDNIRWLGSARFTIGFLLRILGKTIYPADISMCIEHETKADVRAAYAAKAASDAPEERTLPPTGTTLPLLRYGTVNDPLPSTWTPLSPYNNLGNFYAGNMAYMSADASFFPAALPDDGCLDLVTIDGNIARHKSIQLLLAVAKGTFFDMPEVNYRKVTAYRIIPKQQGEGYISIDGERIPFEPFQVEVHKGLGTVLTRSGRLYEAKGP
jgi:sphingosine kinase